MKFNQLLEGSYFSFTLKKSRVIYYVAKKTNFSILYRTFGQNHVLVTDKNKIWKKPVFIQLDY